MVEKDPFLNFISDLSEKIKISKEHKQIMERVNDPKAIIDESKASLDNLILTIKEKIEYTVTNKENVPALSSTQTTPLTSTIIKVVSEEENNFQDFVGKLKGILAKPREVSEDKTTTSSVSSLSASPVKSEGQEDTKKYVNVLNQPKTKKNKNTQNYVEELEKIKDGIQIEKEDTKVTEIKKLIEEYAEKYIKKAVGMMGESGGGTVAVQYANGGTMNGDLNVNGNYLSGGVNLLDIFALQPDLDNQTLTYNDSNYNLSISKGNTVNLSSINTTFNVNSGKYESVYTTVSNSSADWSSVYTTFNANSALYVLSGGNTNNSSFRIGTNDAFNFSLETNNTSRIDILSSGEITLNPVTNITLLSSVQNLLTVRGAAVVCSDISTLSALSGISPGQFSAGGMLLGSNEGGAYLGRVGVRESSWQVVNGTEGVNWTPRDSVRDWLLVAMSSDGRIQTAGVGGGGLYTSTDYGMTWTPRDSVRAWRTIAMSSDGRIQTATANGDRLYTSTDYGITWTPRDSNRSWNGVAMSSDGRIQTATSFLDLLYTSTDYGITWTPRDSVRAWRYMAMSSDGRIQTAAVVNGRLYTSTDYGITWTSRDSNRYWSGVAMSSDGRIQTAAVGGDGFTTGRLYTSTDYGITWTSRDSNRSWNGVAMSSDGRIQTATASGGLLYTSTNYGITWTPRDSNRFWFGVAMSSDGRIQTAAVTTGLLYTSYATTVTPNPVTVLNSISSTRTIFASGGNSNQWNSNWTTTNSNSANWSSVYTSFNSNSGKYDSNWTTTNSNSAKWSSVYTNVNSNSAYYALTNQNTIFEKNVTIQGNLTALGTSTFQNTIFTTTSALSVVNLGPGPALYVYQAAGPYDVASFYDGDGVEVLHVGNAQGGGNPLGQVGINTSFPSAELTVNGAISSNGLITVLGGNSNQWNSAYTNLVTNSATYLSGSSDNKYFYKDINFTANANTKYSSGTRFGAITATLPSGVVVGDCIEFFDADGTWNTNSLIIDNNSYFIEGIYDRLSCNTRYGAFKLIYTGTDSVGWRIVPLPKHSVNSPTLASVTTNGQVITASSSQFNLIIDNSVNYFTFYINSTAQISLSNRYDMNNFANCSLSAFNATNVNIDTNPLFIQNTAILSSGSDNYYTLYYSNTGSSIVNVSYSQSVPRSLARDQVVIAYNQNSQESIDVANYYKNNRPLFSEVRTVGLNIPQAVYPARIASNGIYFCASGCDIDVPYEGCRRYDFISTSLVQTQIVDPIANYISTYPTTKYIVFTLDVPTLVIPDNIWGLSVLSATQIPSMGANVTKSVQTRTGIYPTYITGALSADCIAYIDKLKTATTDGITLYKSRSKIYTEDSYGAGYDWSTYYQYPETISALSAYSVYRSGAPTRKSSGQGLTGIFMDQSSSWSHNTGNIAISSIAIWGTWGFNGRRYIAPNGPYRYNISGEGEVPGLSSMSYYTDPGCSGKLTFTGPDNGWYFNYTIESWNGAPHGGAYGYFGGNAGNKFWGSFPTTYTGVKTFSAFKASAQYSRGLRPLRHSCYTQYFAKNAFGGINYENTPVVWVGHSFEPFYPGAITNTYMRSWAGGSTAYATITGSLQNSNPMVIIGDPLVKMSLNSI